MIRAKKMLDRVIFSSLAFVLLVASGGVPLYVHADEQSCSPAAASVGIQQPTGSDAGTYTYNACTGLWENPHYTWNPSTKVTTPLTPYIYTYNDSTGKWDTDKWIYSPASSSWHTTTLSVDQPPAGSQTVGGPKPVVAAAATTNTSAPTQPTAAVDTTLANQTAVDNNTTAALANTITSNAISGDVTQQKNTTGGNTTSGTAQAIANVMNLLQSSSSLGANVATFVANIDGTVQGDLLIDPSQLQPALTSAALSAANKVDINNANNGVIDNTITLNAASGNVNSTENTKTGNATSGSAEAIANVINMVNSMIAAKQSFLGVININGDLQGNILMPQSFLDTLLASNAPHQTVTIPQEVVNSVTATNTTNQTIINDVKSNATSGTVTSAENTRAGNATSGSAATNVTIFDLTNNQVSASNAMLVFVNVLGTWVGLIMDAPPGSTAAAFGSGVSINPLSVENTVAVNNTNTGLIKNTIAVGAQSGNVSQTKNTTAGNATSGDAHTAVNLANIMNSSFTLANWFGVLFINVFGSWHGSFGVMKPAQSNVATAGSSGANAAAGSGPVFGFIAKAHSGHSRTKPGYVTSSFVTSGPMTMGGDTMMGAEVLGSTTSSTPVSSVQHTTSGSSTSPQTDDHTPLVAIGAGLFVFGLLLSTADSYWTRRHHIAPSM